MTTPLLIDPFRDPEIPNFPSSAEGAHRQYSRYFEEKAKQGLTFHGELTYSLGNETRKLWIFYRSHDETGESKPKTRGRPKNPS